MVSWKAQIHETSGAGEGAEEMTKEGGEVSRRREKESVREKIKNREDGRRGRPAQLLLNSREKNVSNIWALSSRLSCTCNV